MVEPQTNREKLPSYHKLSGAFYFTGDQMDISIEKEEFDWKKRAMEPEWRNTIVGDIRNNWDNLGDEHKKVIIKQYKNKTPYTNEEGFEWLI